MAEPTCTIDGCEKPLRSPGASWCKMHYHRWYRHGDPNRVATKVASVSLGRRYKQVYAPGHPIAPKSGHVYEHRMVLFDEIGLGPHSCHWCEREIDWLPKGHPDELQPDHLNNDGGDNRIENLVPTCRNCNYTRGLQRRSDALRDAGWWSHHDTVGALATGRKPRVA